MKPTFASDSLSLSAGWMRRACAVLALAASLGARAGAQDSAGVAAGVGARRAEVTRAELDSTAAQAEQAAASATGAEKERLQSEAAAIRSRLTEGDFFAGDRFILTVKGGEKDLSDTVVVGPARTITLEGLPDISLRGVLRSELESQITRELSRYIKSPVVTTRPLLRLTLQGSIGKPGFYVLPTDMALSDVIMSAGGPASNAALDKTVIRRADAVVFSKQAVSNALREGTSIDQLGLHNGDVVDVGLKKQRSLVQIVPIITASVTLLTFLISLAARRR